MSRHIGTKEVFSIEYEFDAVASARDQRWLYGHMCFWIRRNLVGDYEAAATLAVALAVLPDLLINRGKRYDETLFAAPTTEAFSAIFSALSVDSGQSDEEVSRDETWYSRFRAIPVGLDIFDNWDAYLIENPVEGRFLFRRVNSKVKEARIPAGEFDRVLEEFINILQNEFDRRSQTTK